jgi:hypothetical protein
MYSAFHGYVCVFIGQHDWPIFRRKRSPRQPSKLFAGPCASPPGTAAWQRGRCIAQRQLPVHLSRPGELTGDRLNGKNMFRVQALRATSD